MIPDLLTCAVVAVGVWTFLRLISNERERLQAEIAAAVAAMPSLPADSSVPQEAEAKTSAATKLLSAAKQQPPAKPSAR